MNPYYTKCRSMMAFVLVAGVLLLVCGYAPAQGTEDPVSPEEVTADAGAEESETVVVNLNNVKIDHVVKFLSEITGLPVIKQKDVQVQLTVVSPAEVSRERAFALVTEALLLEKVAVVRNQDSIRIIPVDLLSDVVVDLLSTDTDGMTGGIARVMIPVAFADVAEIEKVVKGLLSKTGSLVADPSSKQIMVTDSVRRINSIRDVVKQLDVLNTDKRRTQVFKLKHADAKELAPILKSVLSVLAAKTNGQAALTPQQQQQQQQRQQQQQQRQQGGQKPQQSSGGLLEVVPYPTANWLVVVAPEEIMAAAIPLVEEFDTEKAMYLSLNSLPVKYTDVREVARALTTVFRRQPQKRVQDTVEVTYNQQSSTLVVLSSEENFELIKGLVEELDTEESVQMDTRTYALQYADAEDIAEQMNELHSLNDSSNSRFGGIFFFNRPGSPPRTRFVPERRTNSLIAIARPNEFESIEALLKELDIPLDPDQVSPRIFRVKYIDAKEVTGVLNEVFGGEDSSRIGGYYDYLYRSSGSSAKDIARLYGKVRFVTETTTNSIIVTTNNVENFPIIFAFIKELDTMSDDAGNTMVVALQHADARDLANQLNIVFALEGSRMPQQQQRGQNQQQQQQQQQQQPQQPAFYSWLYGSRNTQEDKRLISNLIGQVRVVPNIRTNSLMISTAPQNYQLLRNLISELDIPSPKVLVRVRLIEVTTTDASRIGTRFTSDTSILEADDFDNGLLASFGGIWADANSSGTIQGSANVDIGVLIQFLSRNATTRILSTPTLTMNNNEIGEIFVGSRIPFITNSQTTPEGSLNQSFEYRDAGTTLKITPNINELDRVEMEIELESSQIRPGEVLFGGFIIDTRQFNTEMAVNSGDTIVIGGILRESESKGVRRVPILGRIPILNLAFRKKDSKTEVTELIAFITPTVLRDADADTAATEDAIGRFPNIQEWRPMSDDAGEVIEAPKVRRKASRRGRGR